MNIKEKTGWVVIRLGDKFLLLPLTLAFALGFGTAFYAIAQWQPENGFDRSLKFMGQELSLTLLLFSALVFIRCFISTKKLDSALASITRKVVIAMMLIGCALTALLFLFTFSK
jgi:hypothetical protein